MTDLLEAPGLGRVHVVWLDWDDFRLWLSGRLRWARTAWGEAVTLPPPWAPGQHIALVGPTGEGKSTLAIGILMLRKWVLALDPKGKDDTLEASGWMRTTAVPRACPPWHLHALLGYPREECQINRRIADGLPVKLLVGGAARTDEEDLELQELMRKSITYARHSGGWTLYVDEFELLSSQRMFRLGPNIERMLITARRDKTSVVTSFQAAAWVSKHATRQATCAILWPTRDRMMIKNVAESMGRLWQDVAAAVDLLPPFHVLVIPKQVRAPMIITSAPRLSGGPAATRPQAGQGSPPEAPGPPG